MAMPVPEEGSEDFPAPEAAPIPDKGDCSHFEQRSSVIPWHASFTMGGIWTQKELYESGVH
jgi:hypothetical protein